MADPGRFPQVEFEAALRELAPRYPYPPTPDLARSVRVRLVAQPARRPMPAWRDPRRLAMAAALLLVIAGAAALVSPASRDAIAHFFHVPGVIVNRVPSPAPSPSVSAFPLSLGRPMSLADAQSQVTFHIVVPSDPTLGEPDGLYVDSDVPGGEVAFAYGPRPGIPVVRETGLGVLITEFRGDLAGDILKEAGPDTTVEKTTVNGDDGWWIAGAPHVLVVKESPPNARPELMRLAANTLIWTHDGVTYRIESSLTKAEALRIAVSLP
jgi:hypothetical protein